MQPDADGLGQNCLRTRPRGAYAAEVPSLPAHVPVARCDLVMMYFRSFRNARSRITCSLPARRCASWTSGGSGNPGTMMRTLRPRTQLFQRRREMRHVCTRLHDTTANVTLRRHSTAKRQMSRTMPTHAAAPSVAWRRNCRLQ